MKNKKEILIIILSCIFAVGLSAFLYFVVFNNEKSTLSSNNDYQEINLGECNGTWSSWSSNHVQKSTKDECNYSRDQAEAAGISEYCDPLESRQICDEAINDGECFWDVIWYSRTCVEDKNDAFVGVCLNPTFNTSSQKIATDGENVNITGMYQTNAGKYIVTYTPKTGHTFYNGSYTPRTVECEIYRSKTATTGSCSSNLEYDMGEKILASGGNHVIYENNKGTNVGQYTVTVKAESNYAFSDGSTEKTLKCEIKPTTPSDTPSSSYACYVKSNACAYNSTLGRECDGEETFETQGACYAKLSEACSASQYGSNGNCEACPANSTSTAGSNLTLDSCYCLKGYYGSKGNCTKCAAGYTTTDSGKGSANDCSVCETGYTRDSKGKCVESYSCYVKSNGCQLNSNLTSDCDNNDTFKNQTECYRSIAHRVIESIESSVEGTVYLNEAEYEEDGEKYGYITVNYTAKDSQGEEIPATSLTWTINASPNLNNVVVSSEKSGNEFIVTYRGLGCDKPNVTVSVTATGGEVITGSTTSSNIIITTKYRKWTQSVYNKKNINNYPLLSQAHESDSCYAVSEYDEKTGTYKYLHNRCCGSSPSSPSYACYVKGDDYKWETSAPAGYTKVEGISEKGRCIPACYSNGTEYEWTNNPKTGYTQVTKITTSDLCKKEEEACYLYNGNYFWGKYQNTVGYEKQTAIKEEKYCNNPTTNPESACYKNESTNDYVWTDNAPSGYTKVADITSPNACSLPEVPACYLYNNQYVWGTHGKETGYNLISSVLDEDNCQKPNSACYVDNSGTFVWGDYSLDVNYTLIKDITTKNACLPIEDVPKTDLDTAKIIYIGMVVLLISGIGFIYYVNYNKKKSN